MQPTCVRASPSSVNVVLLLQSRFGATIKGCRSSGRVGGGHGEGRISSTLYVSRERQSRNRRSLQDRTFETLGPSALQVIRPPHPHQELEWDKLDLFSFARSDTQPHVPPATIFPRLQYEVFLKQLELEPQQHTHTTRFSGTIRTTLLEYPSYHMYYSPSLLSSFLSFRSILSTTSTHQLLLRRIPNALSQQLTRRPRVFTSFAPYHRTRRRPLPASCYTLAAPTYHLPPRTTTSFKLATSQQARDHSSHRHDHDENDHDHSHSHSVFGHHHHHGTDPFLTSKDKTDPGVRITRVGLYVNLGMAITKGFGGWVFNSQALVSLPMARAPWSGLADENCEDCRCVPRVDGYGLGHHDAGDRLIRAQDTYRTLSEWLRQD